MKWKVLAIIALCCAFLVPILDPPKAYACSCIKGTVQDELKFTEAILTGKVIGVRDEKRPNIDGGSFIAHIYTIDVGETWKGISSSQVDAVITSDYLNAEGGEISSTCEAYGLEVGQIYLLYSSRNTATGELYAHTGPCNRTALVSDAVDDLRELGPGKIVNGQLSIDKPGVFEQYWWLGAGIVVIIAGGLALLRMWRPRNEDGL